MGVQGIVRFYLSSNFLLVLAYQLTISVGTIILGFDILRINRRRDVKFRAVLMCFAYLFAGHMFGMLFLFMAFISAPEAMLGSVGNKSTIIIVFMAAILISVGIVYFFQRYLFRRLAVDGKRSNELALFLSIAGAPWFYLFFS